MWMTVNSPLRSEIHWWSANILAIRNSGFPPQLSYAWPVYWWIHHFIRLPLSLWTSSGMTKTGWWWRVRVFLIRFSKLFCVIDIWRSFCYMVCGRYFQRLYCVAKSIITVLWGFHQHSCVFICVPLTKRKKKEREKTKQNRDIYLKWELLWHEECFYFITFGRKLTRKTFAGKEDTRVFL